MEFTVVGVAANTAVVGMIMSMAYSQSQG